MASFQLAGITTNTASSFNRCLAEKKIVYCLLFKTPDDNSGECIWSTAPSSIKHCLYWESFSEISQAHFRF